LERGAFTHGSTPELMRPLAMPPCTSGLGERTRTQRRPERLERLRARPPLTLRTIDAGVWAATIALGAIARYAFQPPSRVLLGTVVLAAYAAALALVLGSAIGLHRMRYVLGSAEETVALGFLNLLVGAAVIVANFGARPQLVPLSVVVFAPFVATVCTVAPRLAYRTSADRRLSPDPANCRRVIVFGAGEAGSQIVRALLRQRDSDILPVALLDDDPKKANLSIMGVAGVGDRHAPRSTAAAVKADTLLVAVPSAQPELKQELADAALECGLDLRILPRLSELIDATSVSVNDIREVSEIDLLGRPQVDIDLDLIASYLAGRCVLVTGAGGSIGSEICRQIHRFAPRRLVMLDRDESALHSVQLSLEGRALLTDESVIVADIRDRERIGEIFLDVRPDVVFHAAALKHLPLLELHPEEALKTNVWGTQNLLDAAQLSGCGRFVNISTDKAADPVSVLGYTKHLAERLTAGMADRASGVFLSVRFGNVLGSRGSVLPTFRKQIACGGPVTVTHPDVTRFFMTTEEAVLLVVQAGAVGEPGEVLVLDMGSPVRIDDVARRLIAQSGKRIAIEYTGLRPGEKLNECLLGANEEATTRSHPTILHTRVAPFSPVDLEHLTPSTLPGIATGQIGPGAPVDESLGTLLGAEAVGTRGV
jgi:FlaA1/EpsC-like NDP-sugar epimerase